MQWQDEQKQGRRTMQDPGMRPPPGAPRTSPTRSGSTRTNGPRSRRTRSWARWPPWGQLVPGWLVQQAGAMATARHLQGQLPVPQRARQPVHHQAQEPPVPRGRPDWATRIWVTITGRWTGECLATTLNSMSHRRWWWDHRRRCKAASRRQYLPLCRLGNHLSGACKFSSCCSDV